MISDYRELLRGTAGQYRRDLIHAMLVDDTVNADPANGKTPYLRSKQKRKELILQAIEEGSHYEIEEWLYEAYAREFGYPYVISGTDEEDGGEDDYE